jgi:hypothetical protein
MLIRTITTADKSVSKCFGGVFGCNLDPHFQSLLLKYMNTFLVFQFQYYFFINTSSSIHACFDTGEKINNIIGEQRVLLLPGRISN